MSIRPGSPIGTGTYQPIDSRSNAGTTWTAGQVVTSASGALVYRVDVTHTGAFDTSKATQLGGTSVALTPTVKTSSYSAVVNDFVLADATSAAVPIALVSSPATGAWIAVKKTDGTANTVTVTPAGGGTIDGDANLVIASRNYGAILEHTGSNAWKIVSIMSGGGSNGVDGHTILNGTTAPGSGTGSNGDFYIDTAASRLYGPKAAGAWPGTYTSLIGPAGSNGSNGTNGTNGAISTIQDEGVDLTVRAKLNFIGSSVTAADDAANGRTNITVQGGGQSFMSTKSGLYLAAPGPTYANTALSTGYVIWYPIFIPACTVNAIGVNVYAAGTAGATCSLGIYSDDGAGRPNALLVSGSVVTTATGYVEAAISQALSAGIYWLAVLPVTAGFSTYGVWPTLNIPATSAALATAQVSSMYTGGGITSLPSSFSGSSPFYQSGNGNAASNAAPKVLLKVA